MKAVERLEDPFSMDIRKVKATKDIYRVKVGKWRVFIKINFKKKVVYVLKFDWREGAYNRI